MKEQNKIDKCIFFHFDFEVSLNSGACGGIYHSITIIGDKEPRVASVVALSLISALSQLLNVFKH